MKQCRKCLKILPLDRFKKSRSWVMLDCRTCYYKHIVKPYRASKRKSKIRLTEEEKKVKRKEYRKKYKDNNPEKIAEQRRRNREKRSSNPIYKVQRNIRKRLKKQLDKGFRIGQSSEMLGCSLVEFKLYIEAQFYDDMTWENYGTYWHIDHIKPVCSFNLACPNIASQVNHYTNLRPLKAEDNIKKSIEDSKLKFVTDQPITQK